VISEVWLGKVGAIRGGTCLICEVRESGVGDWTETIG